MHIWQKKISGFFFVDVIYNNYDDLSESHDDISLGKFGKDFYNYDYYIGRYGDFDEETEVRAEWH